jgi:hypothetical protein
MPMDKKPPVARTVKGLRVPTLKLAADSQVSRTAEPKVALSETGWIGAIDALYLLAPYFGEEGSAKAELMLRLSRGDLTCRAACWCQEADRGKVDKHDIDWSGYNTSRPHDGQRESTILQEPKEEEGRVSVPKDIFLSSNGWMINAGETDWKLGYFIGRKPVELLNEATDSPASNKFIRRFAYGLEFHLSEIGVLIHLLGAAKPTTIVEDEAVGGLEEPRKLGRPQHKSWPNWVAEVVVLKHQNKINGSTKASDILRWVGDRLAKRELDVPHKSNTHPAADAVIEALQRLEAEALRAPKT